MLVTLLYMWVMEVRIWVFLLYMWVMEVRIWVFLYCQVFVCFILGILVYIFHDSFNGDLWDVNLLSRSMECLCMTPLTPAMMVIRGIIFHPLFWSMFINESYLAYLCMVTCSRNMLWQYVKSYEL